MKLHVIYSKGSEDGFIPPQIFAFTKDKELLNLFITQRNMDKYVVKTFDSEEVGRENLFREMDRYNGRSLIKTGFRTKVDGRIVTVKMAATLTEDVLVMRRCEELIPNYLMNYGLANIKVLNDENLQLLDKIHVFDVVSHLGLDDPFWDGLICLEPWVPEADQLAVLIDIIEAEESGLMLNGRRDNL